ncbi:hypothetical protein MRX96_022060 [Rhipicephalus microplus]
MMQPAVSICVRRVARAIVNATARNNRLHFPRTAEEKATMKEEFLRIFVADMPILAVDLLRPGLDDDSHICFGPRV